MLTAATSIHLTHLLTTSKLPLPYPTSVSFYPLHRHPLPFSRHRLPGPQANYPRDEKLGEATIELVSDSTNVNCSFNLSVEDLCKKIPLVDALIVGSKTNVSPEVLESSYERLRIVDNVDLLLWDLERRWREGEGVVVEGSEGHRRWGMEEEVWKWGENVYGGGRLQLWE